MNINDLSNYLEKNNKEKIQEFTHSLNNTNTHEFLSTKTDDGWNPLQLAAYYNNTELMTQLLNFADYDQINNNGKHPVFIALEEKSDEILECFKNENVVSKINFQYSNNKNEKFLYHSIYYDNMDFAHFLVQNNCSVFEPNGFQNNLNNTPLNLLIQKNSFEFFKHHELDQYLSENFDELYFKNSIIHKSNEFFNLFFPHTSLREDDIFELCNDFDNIYAMEKLLTQGHMIAGEQQITKLVSLMSKPYEDPLEQAAAIAIADYFVSINLPFSKFKDENGKNAWMLCIENNNPVLFDKLFTINSNLNIGDNDGYTPLFYAIEQRSEDFVSLLLQKGANPALEDKYGNTAIIKAVEIGNPNILNKILEYGHNINKSNIRNETALILAIKNRRMDLVSSLIWAGGEIAINPVQFIEEEHIFQFGLHGNTEKFSYHDEKTIDNFVALSQLGFNLNQKNADGDNFLLHFIKNGYLSNFKALMRCNVPQTEVDSNGENALMLAAKKHNPDYFMSILNKFNKIDYEHKNNNDQNIYDICLKTLSVEKCEALLKNDPNPSKENILKILPLIAKQGNIKTFEKSLDNISLDWDNFTDHNSNNLLMLSIAGGNNNNFDFILDKMKNKPSTKHVNINKKTYKDLLLFLPEDLQELFYDSLKNNLKTKKP